MIVRDVTNTRPPDQIAAWLDGLGEFEQIEPAEAAERWGVTIREAMERLHSMTGGPLEIPECQIERYRRVEWTPGVSRPRNPGFVRPAEIRKRRAATIPEAGITIREAAELWELSPDAAADQLQQMTKAGWLERIRTGNRVVFKPTRRRT